LELASTPEDQAKIQESIDHLLANRAFLADKVTEIVSLSVNNDGRTIDRVLNEKVNIQDYICYGDVLEYFNSHCFSLSKNEYVGTYAHTLVNMCEMGISSQTIKDAMDKTCTFSPREGIN